MKAAVFKMLGKIMAGVWALCIATSVYAINHIDSLVREARLKASENDLEGAAVLYHQALQMDSGNINIRRELAQVLVEANVRSPESERVAAIEAIEKEIEKPVFSSARFSLPFLSNGALTLADQAMEKEVLLILEKLQNNDNTAAIHIAQTLQKKYPLHPVPYNLLGLAWVGKGNLKAAKPLFEKALTLRENFHAARLNLAELESHLGKFQLAHQTVDRVLNSDSNNRRAHLIKAQLYTLQGQSTQALQWSTKASEIF